MFPQYKDFITVRGRSNIMKFEGGGNNTSDVKYSVEFWIFKPKSKKQQVSSGCSNIDS